MKEYNRHRMKGSYIGLFSIVLFLILVSFFSVSLLTIPPEQQFLNQSNTNLTIITTGSGLTQVNICNFHSDIPVFAQLIWGVDCIGDFIEYLYNIATVSSGIQWLGYIIIACIIAIIYLAVRLFRGGG